MVFVFLTARLIEDAADESRGWFMVGGFNWTSNSVLLQFVFRTFRAHLVLFPYDTHQ
jgi:hypothetical protein